MTSSPSVFFFVGSLLVLHEGLLHMSLSAVSQNVPLSCLRPDHALLPRSLCLLQRVSRRRGGGEHWVVQDEAVPVGGGRILGLSLGWRQQGRARGSRLQGLKLVRGGQDGDLLDVGLGLVDRLEGHLQDLRLALALLLRGVRLERLELGAVLRHQRAGMEGELGLLSGLHELDGHLQLQVSLLLVVSRRRGVDGGQGDGHRHLHGVEALVLSQQNHLVTHLLGHMTHLGHLSHLLPVLAQLLHLPVLPHLADVQVGDLGLHGVSWQLQQGRRGCDEGASVGSQRLGDQHLWMTLGLMGHNAVLLLKLLTTDGAGELICGISVVFLHVPVERRLLATGETADLTPSKWEELRKERQ